MCKQIARKWAHGSSLYAFLLVVLGALSLPACQPADEAPQVTAQQKQQLRAQSEAFAGRSIALLKSDHAAMRLAEQLFVARCASCHGESGQGSGDVSALARGNFNYGTSKQAIRTTIRDGRQSIMPAMGRELGEVALGQVVAYVRSLPSDAPLSNDEARGKAFYAEHCARCHGPEGRGIQELGAPNLVDDYWRNGDSMMSIRLTITAGIESESPPFAGKLTATEIDLLTAHVLKLIDAN